MRVFKRLTPRFRVEAVIQNHITRTIIKGRHTLIKSLLPWLAPEPLEPEIIVALKCLKHNDIKVCGWFKRGTRESLIT